jgi:hypothetical protein
VNSVETPMFIEDFIVQDISKIFLGLIQFVENGSMVGDWHFPENLNLETIGHVEQLNVQLAKSSMAAINKKQTSIKDFLKKSKKVKDKAAPNPEPVFKSEKFVVDSDDDINDEEFFAKEKALREKINQQMIEKNILPVSTGAKGKKRGHEDGSIKSDSDADIQEEDGSFRLEVGTKKSRHEIAEIYDTISDASDRTLEPVEEPQKEFSKTIVSPVVLRKGNNRIIEVVNFLSSPLMKNNFSDKNVKNLHHF